MDDEKVIALLEIIKIEMEDRLITYPYDEYDHGKNVGIMICKDVVSRKIEALKKEDKI